VCPVMSGENLAVAAGALVPNVLANQPYVYLPWDAKADIFIVASTGGNKSSLTAGGEQVFREASLPVRATPPLVPDDLLTSELISAGSLLDLQFRNATAAAADFRWMIKLTPLG